MKNNVFDLSGKNAIVTGGSRGLGKSFAESLANAGANIIIVDVDRNEQTEKDIMAYGVNCETFIFNLAEFEKYDQLVNTILGKYKKIDILVNNAGIQRRHPSAEFPKADWDLVLDINLNAVFFMCQAFGRHMIENGYGKIINIASLLAFQGGFTIPAYTAAKSAVMGFSKSLSNEWASKGVNVNCIAPGYIATEMNTALMNDEVRNRQIMERIPAGRWAIQKISAARRYSWHRRLLTTSAATRLSWTAAGWAANASLTDLLYPIDFGRRSSAAEV